VVGKRDYALLLFYFLTGLRRSEVIGLRGKATGWLNFSGAVLRPAAKRDRLLAEEFLQKLKADEQEAMAEPVRNGPPL
jgi:hypothetical protein